MCSHAAVTLWSQLAVNDFATDWFPCMCLLVCALVFASLSVGDSICLCQGNTTDDHILRGCDKHL